MNNYYLDWSDLVFSSKKTINDLNPIFIAAPREMSAKRFTQIIKDYLPQGNILLGIAKEDYIDGFDKQPQFKTLKLDDVKPIIDKANGSSSKHKIYTLEYFQRDQQFILEKLKPKKVLLVNGSWQRVFHSTPSYYVLANKRVDYELISTFVDETEAKAYETRILPEETQPKGKFNDSEMLDLANAVAKRSFDHSFQTGVTLGIKKGTKYKFMAQSFNKIEPYQTYAMLNGSIREINFSPTHDLNYYDTAHAEIRLIIDAQKRKLDLTGTTLFTNLLPCRNCARMLCDTDIKEVVYINDHSEGFAAKLFQDAGIKVRRVVQ